MGLAATQARFLELTARKSNLEYEAQQINFQRLQKTNNLQEASREYQDKMSNKKIIYRFNTGSGLQSVDLSYNNYKSYMNQQMKDLSIAMDRYFLVSSSGNKIVVASEADREEMLNSNDNFTADDFIIDKDVTDVNKFQNGIREGVYSFAKLVRNDETTKMELKKEGWESLGGGALYEEYDTSDDAEAQAKFEAIERQYQKEDKLLEMRLKELETEREAISTELDSVSKVLDEAVKKGYGTFNGNG